MNQTVDMVKLVEDIFAPAQKSMNKAKKSLVDYFTEIEKKREDKGNWMHCGKFASRCSKCDKLTYWDKDTFGEYDYCPWCGADMRGEE